jgi:simple sugar transport system permease protein
MDEKKSRLIFGLGSVIAAILLTAGIIAVSGSDPIAAYKHILLGAAGSSNVAANVLVSWIPLLLATTGLLFTFTVGLWNIGIEGQITLGAVFSVWAMRSLQESGLPPEIILLAAVLSGVIGGALWALLAGSLKTFGGVNEIFGGLGLNFVATALNLWLIFGPWKRPGVASMSGTLPFDPKLWMPTLNPQSRLALVPLGLALAGTAFAFVMLRGTHFGLRLKAVGRNPVSAYMLGIPTWQHMMLSFALCGAFAGLAGAVQVTAIYHRLIPSISSGYGYSGLMVAMLSNFSAVTAAPVALFFAALNVGSIQLPIMLKLDSSFAGVIQGFLVLFVLLGNGIRTRLASRKGGRR